MTTVLFFRVIMEGLPKEVISEQRPDEVREMTMLICERKAFQVKRKDAKALQCKFAWQVRGTSTWPP